MEFEGRVSRRDGGSLLLLMEKFCKDTNGHMGCMIMEGGYAEREGLR